MKEKHEEDFDALYKSIVLLKTGLSYLALSVKSDDGTALSGVCIEGFKDEFGSSITTFTNRKGIASGYISPGSSYKLYVKNMLDIADKTFTLNSPVAGNEYQSEFVVTPAPYRMITSSGTYYISSYYSHLNYELIGGGGGGASAYTNHGGGGGGGGNTFYGETLIVESKAYAITIGSGGSAGSNSGIALGYNGGESSAFGQTATGGGGGGGGRNDSTTTASNTNNWVGGTSTNGGAGGKGYYASSGQSGEQGQARSGSDGSCTYHTSLTETGIAAGGGGGGRSPNDSYLGVTYGGKDCGASCDKMGTNTSASAGRRPGGGGSGGRVDNGCWAGSSGGAGALVLLFAK